MVGEVCLILRRLGARVYCVATEGGSQNAGEQRSQETN